MVVAPIAISGFFRASSDMQNFGFEYQIDNLVYQFLGEPKKRRLYGVFLEPDAILVPRKLEW